MDTLCIDLLLALRAAGRYGLGVDELLTDMRRGRHRELTLPQLEQALRDLADQSFARTMESALGKKTWRITKLGGDALSEDSL